MKIAVYIILCISLVAFLYLYTNVFNGRQLNNRPCTEMIFDSKLWKDSFYFRGRMVNDLIRSKRLISLEKDSIKQLLGTPSGETSYMLDYLVDMNCGNEKYGEMILYFEIDSVKNKVVDYWLTD